VHKKLSMFLALLRE